MTKLHFGKIEDIIRTAFMIRKPINEYDDLQEKIFEGLELWRKGVKKEEIGIILTDEICMGKFANYDIYIPNLHYVWLGDLKNVKGYEMWSVWSWNQGLKLCCSSTRTKKETLRGRITV